MVTIRKNLAYLDHYPRKDHGQNFLSNNKLINKPKSRSEAFEILKDLNNSKHYLISSVCISKNGAMIWNYSDTSELKMKNFSEKQLLDYLNKIKTYRDRNPYHHYNLSLLAISDKNYSLALRSIKKAIGLKADEAGFYYQQSLIYQQLQQLNQSRTALLLAIANSQDKKSLRSYQKQLRVLDQQIKPQNNN